MPAFVVPRFTEGEADLEEGSALLSPPRRWTGGRDEASAPSWGVAVAEDVSFGVDSFSAGVGGFASASPSSLGTTVSVGSPAAGVSKVCGVATSVASLVLSVARPAVAPPLPPARARVLPLPRGFGGIVVSTRLLRLASESDSAVLSRKSFLSIARAQTRRHMRGAFITNTTNMGKTASVKLHLIFIRPRIRKEHLALSPTQP